MTEKLLNCVFIIPPLEFPSNCINVGQYLDRLTTVRVPTSNLDVLGFALIHAILLFIL